MTPSVPAAPPLSRGPHRIGATLALLLALLLATTAREASAQDSTATVIVDQVQVRSAPSITASAVATLTRGVKVTIKGRDNAWTIIDIAGKRGYVRTAQLSDATEVVGSGGAAPAPTQAPARPAAAPPSRTPPAAAAPASAPPPSAEATTAPSGGAPTPRRYRDRFVIELAGAQQLVTDPDAADSDTDDEPTIGFDAQARLRLGRMLSVGAGYVRTSRTETETLDGLDLDGTLVYAGPYLEPRVSLPLGALDLFAHARLGLLNGAVDATATDASSSASVNLKVDGMQYVGGVGVNVHLGSRLSLVLSGSYGTFKTSGSTTTIKASGEETQVLKDDTKESGRLRVLRVGLAFGF